MTLSELRRAHPMLFYSQAWFDGQPFMERRPDYNVGGALIDKVSDLNFRVRGALSHRDAGHLPSAATLAALYVADPTNDLWQHWLWTADHDDHGQRVYVGCNGKGFEIHRHIHLNERFGVAVWR